MDWQETAELFRKVTEFLGNLSVKPRLLEDNRLSCTLENKSRIVSLPSSEATIRGFSGANLIVEDESARVEDILYKTIRPMLAVSNGKLVLLSTPFGKRGHFYEEWTNYQGWKKLEVKATECPRIDPEFLEEEKRSLGEWWFRQEYMCEFMEPVDQVFSYDLVMQSLSSDVRPLFDG